MYRTILICAGTLAVGCAADVSEDESPAHSEWSYDGEHGPEHWGDVAIECVEGVEQSPIDLPGDAKAVELPDLETEYGTSDVYIVNNGHTVVYDYAPGSYLHIGDTEYELLQFHFHAASEHTLDGVAYPMELHLVHASADGEYAVLGVFIEEGETNKALAAADWKKIPKETGGAWENAEMLVDAASFIPAGDTYRYPGSLTTPPCSEAVAWNVFAEPIELSAAQIERFTDLHPNSFRPLQEVGDRRIVFGQ